MFFNSDYFFMGRLRDLLAETMERQASLYRDQDLMHSSLFVDLITGRLWDRDQLRERLKFLDWRVTDSMYLLSVGLEAAHGRLSPPDYIPDGFKALAAYDQSHSSGLLDTLELYIACGGITPEALDSLGISKSTAYYRLGKIRELCRMGLGNGSVRMRLAIASAAYRLYGQEVL